LHTPVQYQTDIKDCNLSYRS